MMGMPMVRSTTSSPHSSSLSGSTGIRLLSGKYLLLEQSEALTWVATSASAQHQQHPQPSSVCYKCIEVETQRQYTCKVRKSAAAAARAAVGFRAAYLKPREMR